MQDAIKIDGRLFIHADFYCNKIQSSEKMVEYANFTPQQEVLWMKIWTEVTQLLNEMKS